MDITSGLLDTINGKIPAFPQVYTPYPRLEETRPGYVWKVRYDVMEREPCSLNSSFMRTTRS
jgi:hypothetical protein